MASKIELAAFAKTMEELLGFGNTKEKPFLYSPSSFLNLLTNLAMFSGLNPTKATLLEQKSSPFVNLVAVRPDEVNLPKMKALAKALTSPEMKQFIQQKYHGAVVPAF